MGIEHTRAGHDWLRPLLAYSKDPDGFSSLQRDKEVIPTMRRISSRNLLMASELRSLLPALNEAAIPAIVLKGSYLALSHYPYGVRPVGDIDLLIRPEDYKRADRVLGELGYKVNDKNMPLWMLRDFACRISYEKEKNPVFPVDLHFRLGPYPYLGRIDPAGLWENARPAVILENPVSILAPEYFLLHLCLHLFSHRHENWLVSCCDIAQVIRRSGPEIDWDRFLRIVKKERIPLPVNYSLDKTCEVLGPIVPLAVLRRLAGCRDDNMLERRVFSFLKERGDDRRSFDYLVQYLTTPGILLKIRCLPQIFFPPAGLLEEEAKGGRLKSLLAGYFSYYLRLFRVAGRFISFFWGRK